MTTVKEINHDSSTTLSVHYTDTVINTDGAATVTGGAALNSSTFGVNYDLDTTSTNIILVETFTALAGNDLRFRFRIDFSGATTIPANLVFRIDLEDSVGNDIFRVRVEGAGSNLLEVDADYWSDGSAGLVSIGGFQSISENSEVCIELRAIKETADTNADGEVELFANGVSLQSISNADNFNRFGNQIARTNVTLSPGTGEAGAFFYDEWILDDDNTADLGCGIFSGYNLVLGGGQV